MKPGKRFKKASAKVDKKKFYTIEEAVAIVKETATAKFNESVDIAVRLGVDPKKADQCRLNHVFLEPAGPIGYHEQCLPLLTIR